MVKLASVRYYKKDSAILHSETQSKINSRANSKTLYCLKSTPECTSLYMIHNKQLKDVASPQELCLKDPPKKVIVRSRSKTIGGSVLKPVFCFLETVFHLKMRPQYRVLVQFITPSTP